MLGVGWTEMLVIGIVALIVIGPKELPALMHRIGKFAGTIRRMGFDFQRELNKTTGLNEITNLRNSVTQPLKATADAIRKEFNTTTASGAVQPSGIIKPADPKAESVVNEIKAAAGLTPAAAAPAMTPLAAATVAAAPVKAKRPAKVAAPVSSTVAVADIPPASKASKAKKPIESPAPVEAIAPAKPAKVRTAAKVAAKPMAATELVVAKPAAAATSSAAKSATAMRKPAAKPSTGEKT